MNKKWMYVIGGIMVISLIGHFLGITTPKEEPPRLPLNYKVAKSFEDISKKFYHCEIILSEAEVKAFERATFIERIAAIAEKEACGESRFFLSESARLAQSSSSHAQAHPEDLKGYVCSYNAETKEFVMQNEL